MSNKILILAPCDFSSFSAAGPYTGKVQKIDLHADKWADACNPNKFLRVRLQLALVFFGKFLNQEVCVRYKDSVFKKDTFHLMILFG